MEVNFSTGIVASIGLIGAVIGAVAVIVASVIANRAQIRIQRENNSFQLELADKNFENDARKSTLDKLADAHKTLNHIERECSTSKLTHLMEEGISKSDFDTKYKDLYKKCDELLAIVGIYINDEKTITACKKISGNMRKFQDYLLFILELKKGGRVIDPNSDSVQKAYYAVQDINSDVASAKYQLTQIAQKILKIG